VHTPAIQDDDIEILAKNWEETMGKERKQSGRLKSRGAEMDLEQPLAERVAAYALGAGAAGLGLMGGAQAAAARIVYTPAYIPFRYGLDAFLDLNNDGIKDFRITAYDITIFGPAYLAVNPAPGNGVRDYVRYLKTWASRLPRGAKIGAGEAFSRGDRNASMATCTSTYFRNGPWVNGGSGFLGLEFQINGKAHYGWAEVTVPHSGACPGFMGVVMGYAYNTMPNQPILADQRSDEDTIGGIPPRPATLGLLALGAHGLDIWRPRKRELTTE